MKKLIIHPGYGKTGTTAIQKIAFHNLQHSSELCYVPIGITEECHNSFADCHPKFNNNKFIDYMDELRLFILNTNALNFLISSEFLVGSSSSCIKILLECAQASGVSVEVILVIRNYPELLYSSYLQSLKTGYGLVYGESIFDYAKRNYGFFSIVRQCSMWLQSPNVALTLLDYDLHKKTFVKDFFSCCGLQNIPFCDLRVNHSLIREFIPIIRNFDKYYKGKAVKERSALIENLLTLSQNLKVVSHADDLMSALNRGYSKLYEADINELVNNGIKIV